jgi:uncharacterized membrane protein YphA (DoxX/SURF4 family)
LALRLLVAFVFLFAVAGKLLDFPEFLRSIAALGWFAEEYAAIVAMGLLACELLAAILLMAGAAYRFGAALSATLAAVFCYVTGSLLLQGVEGDCSCFGIFLRLPRPIMLGVDFALLLSSLYLLRVGAGGSAAATPTQQTSSSRLLALSALFLVLSLALLALVRSSTDLRLHVATLMPSVQSGLSVYRPELDPKEGSTAPRVSLLTTTGQRVGLEAWTDRPTIFLFIGECSTCSTRRVNAWSKLRETGTTFHVVVVTTDDAAGARWLEGKVKDKATVVRDNHRVTTEAYNAVWTPRAYLIGTDGRLLYRQTRAHDLERAVEIVSQMSRSGKTEAK